MGDKIREKTNKSIKRLKTYVKEGNSTYHIWKITSFNKKLNNILSNEVEKVESSFFQVMGTPLKAKLSLSLHNKVWISLKLVFASQKRNDNPHYIYSHVGTFTIFDQTRNQIKQNITFCQESGFRDENTIKWMQEAHGKNSLVRVETLMQKHSIYVRNDTVLIRVALQPLNAIYKLISNTNGVLFWKINNYTKNKQAEMDGLIESLFSDYFYTHSHGYRLQVRAYLTGSDVHLSDYLSLFLYFRRGPWDEFLPQTFRYKVTFTLLDQSNSTIKRHLVKSTEYVEDNITSGFGIGKFASQTEVEKDCYLNNDTILLKVVVEPLDG